MLTGDVGPFSKSHIIPKSFMKRATKSPFKEWDGETRPKRSQTGWYDYGILGRSGEAMIAKFDDVAASCFVDNGFTYSKRRDPLKLDLLRDNFIDGYVYEISRVDTQSLHLFAISLLWRSAVTSLSGFEHITVRARRLEELRQMLLGTEPLSVGDFPAYFIVFDGARELIKMAPSKIKGHPFIRFFLDGVVCYVSPTRRVKTGLAFEQFYVGSDPGLLRVPCVSSASSDHLSFMTKSSNNLVNTFGNPFPDR
ncbi:hypothetical protein [Rhizobium sp. C4]|uniref:hypothetical protein n=1 Tax=Rhizobium sp. C4 TaxID=1349800 RepID=UPI001E56E29B|nr:hypothetical protein [Rhizobium sp. C4]MCD2171335.1 hypothetical protein [Rhizobium sp. C4]